jgi:hypothetical protein
MKYLSTTSSSEWGVPLRIGARLAVLVGLVTGLWIAFALTMGLAEPEPFLGVLDRAAEARPDLLLMGDSTLFWRGPTEKESLSLEDAIAATYPELKVSSISEAALTLDMMEASWRYLRARGAAPRVAIVVVNLRSFSPTWYERPDSYTEKVLHQLTWDSRFVRALYRPLVEFDVLNKKTLKIDEYYRMLRNHLHAAPADFGLDSDSASGAADAKLSARASYYLCYGLPIPEEHPLLRAMTGLANKMRADGVKVLLYITPVDRERGAAEFGPGMVSAIDQNREVVKGAITVAIAADQGLRLLDRADGAPTEDFLDHGGAPNEHLTVVGRERLWADLKPVVDGLLADDD